MGALSNLYFNNIGYNGTGYVGDNFASTMNMMFNGVNGVSIFGCGYPGFGDLGGGFCPNNNAYWGMQAGFAGFNIFTNIVTARIGNHRAAKAEAKAQDAKDNQSYEDALKTLGLNNKTPEELTVDDINNAQLEGKYQTAIDDLNKKIGDENSGLTKEYNDAKTTLSTAESNLKTTTNKIKELTDSLVGKTEDEQKPIQEQIKTWKETEKIQNEAVENAKTVLKEKETALDKAKKELETAKKELETATANHKEAQRIAKEYLPKAQAKAKEDLNKRLDDADGTVASRMWSKNVVQDDNGDYTNNNLAEYTKYDWQKLLCAYRKGNSTVRSQIKTMLNDNENCIKNSKEITTGQQALVESILGKKIFDNE